MAQQMVDITKSSGEKVRFSIDKLRISLLKSGADDTTVEPIINNVRDELYHGISTREIYKRAFALLKKEKGVFASKYKLKKAIYELGPTGFPFEKFVGAILFYSGYTVQTGQVLEGKCVSHEVDVVARKNGRVVLAECKFHNEEGRNCDVKVPLYINARYQDILSLKGALGKSKKIPNEGWVVTNTRFTADALQYGKCSGLYLLSWDHPHENGLRERIDRLGLYPITVSTLLSKREKQFLISRDIVLMRQLRKDSFYLDQLEVTSTRKRKILKEVELLCPH